VLASEQIEAVADELGQVRPWPAISSPASDIVALPSDNIRACGGHREAIERVREDLERFGREADLDAMVMINLASTEAAPASGECLSSLDALEHALEVSDERISASVLYAYAAISSSVPHVNFTPSRTTDWPAMIQLARKHNVPICGKDGKTGQTLLKTALAPVFRDRNLGVEGWFSTNLLGNRDGLVLSDPKALQSKRATKSDVLDAILGYAVPDHQVHIHYYRPRGDAKEAWDSIDLVGFAGQRMQLKLNFLCRDSILAAPLAIELGRLANLAQLRALAGPIDGLGVFFKSPITTASRVEHDFARQQESFERWLAGNASDEKSR
jgi:myo-inositol-1-phosphate synthase